MGAQQNSAPRGAQVGGRHGEAGRGHGCTSGDTGGTDDTNHK